jgi:hypothetical protein
MANKHIKKIEKYKNKIKKFKNKIKKIKYTENFTPTSTPSSTTKPSSDPEKFPGWAIAVICVVLGITGFLLLVWHDKIDSQKRKMERAQEWKHYNERTAGVEDGW